MYVMPPRSERPSWPPRTSQRYQTRRFQKIWGLSGLAGAYANGYYIPSPDQILATPKAGAWYRLKKGDTYWGISKTAYGRVQVKAGLFLMDDAKWNGHIRQAKKNWEAYNREGLQATPNYSATAPRAPYGSGNAYPVVWIPPATGEEPEEIYPRPPAGESIVGPPGPIGPRGPRGPRGLPGESIVGPPGAIGPIGPIGPAGESIVGPRGPRGERGPAGGTAEANEEAIQAAVNAWMLANKQSLIGPRGERGQRGAPGSPGLPGSIGPRGLPGSRGEPGRGPTQEEIADAVAEYFDKNPIPTGGQGKGDKMWALPLALLTMWM